MISLKCILGIHVELVSRQFIDEAEIRVPSVLLMKECIVDWLIRKEMYKTKV